MNKRNLDINKRSLKIKVKPFRNKKRKRLAKTKIVSIDKEF